MSNPTHRKTLARRFAAATGRSYAAALEIVRRAADAGRLPQPLDTDGIEQALATLLEMEKTPAPANSSPNTQPSQRPTDPAEWPTFGTFADGTRAALTGHLVAVGVTGSGKSAMLRALAADAMRLGWAVEAIDVTKMGTDYFEHLALQATGTYPEARFTMHTSMTEAAEVIARLEREMIRRHRLVASAGVTSIAGLADDARPPRVLLLVDEWSALAGGWPREAQASRDDMLHQIARLADAGRSAGIHVALASQRSEDPAWRVVGLNAARVLIGTGSTGARYSVFRSPDTAPTPPSGIGRGCAVMEPLEGEAALLRIDPAPGQKADAPAEATPPAESVTAEAPLPMHPVDVALLAAKTAADRRVVKHPTDQRIWEASWAYEHLTGRQGLVYVSSPGEGADRYVFGDGEEIVEAHGGYTALGRVDAERHILARLDALRRKPHGSR